jgi:hypothetical protein
MDKDYSHRAVVDKLGIRPGHVVRVVGKGDRALLAQARERAGRPLQRGAQPGQPPADVVLYWPATLDEMTPTLAALRAGLVSNGGIWVITAKRDQRGAAGLGYVNQADLIPLGLAAGLVDNKTCSVSERESGMRFVIRRRDRAGGSGQRA